MAKRKICVGTSVDGAPPDGSDIWVAPLPCSDERFTPLCTLASGLRVWVRTESVSIVSSSSADAPPAEWNAVCVVKGHRVAVRLFGDNVERRPSDIQRDMECDVDIEHWATKDGDGHVVFHGAGDWESKTLPLADGASMVEIWQLELSEPWGCAVA